MQATIEKKIRNLFKRNFKGETSELRTGLVSQYAFERKDAIERTIHAMTLGKDVSMLFPDILKNLATHDLDQKKLVYLYLMNYAKTHPELVILAVNTFVQDSEDPNPLIRALAIRTMGCIRVDKMIDFLPGPLEKTLSDESPYVRKTAAIAVAKLFDLDQQLAIDLHFVEKLQTLLDDSNPMVIANAVNALEEIQRRAPETNAFKVTKTVLDKLLAALNECTEWGRISILTAFSEYETADASEAEHICERVVPQFQHANPSVVLMAIRVVITHLQTLPLEQRETLQRKMSSPLVTLLATPPELQYVALRNIRLILQKFPGILNREIKVFYTKYNDPLYLKLEKIEIMVNLVSKENAKQVVTELKEYCVEVDVVFVRHAIKALGQVAIQVPESSELVVDTLLDLLDHHVAYVAQEVVVVMRNILRKYPVFEDAIPRLCDAIDEIDEPESRAALVWILGEYADRIPPVKSLISPFVKSFLEESTNVQLQLLTACVKLYTKKPDEGKELLHEILQQATQKSDNADIRDRAYIYWRLLSSDAELSKSVALAHRPTIASTIDRIPQPLLDELLRNLSTLSSVYYKSPENSTNKSSANKSGNANKSNTLGDADDVQRRAHEEQRKMAHEDEIFRDDNLLDFDSGNAGDGADDLAQSSNILSEIFVTNDKQSGTTSQDILSLFTPVTMPPVESTTNNLNTNTDSSFNLNMNSNTNLKEDTPTSAEKQPFDDLLDF